MSFAKEMEEWMAKNDVVKCHDCGKAIADINANVGDDYEYRCRSCSRKAKNDD